MEELLGGRGKHFCSCLKLFLKIVPLFKNLLHTGQF